MIFILLIFNKEYFPILKKYLVKNKVFTNSSYNKNKRYFFWNSFCLMICDVSKLNCSNDNINKS